MQTVRAVFVSGAPLLPVFLSVFKNKGRGEGIINSNRPLPKLFTTVHLQNSSVKMKEVTLLRWLHIKCWRDKAPIRHSGPVSEPFLPATYTIKSFPSTASSYVLRVRKEPIAMSLHKFMALRVAKPPNVCSDLFILQAKSLVQGHRTRHAARI